MTLFVDDRQHDGQFALALLREYPGLTVKTGNGRPRAYYGKALHLGILEIHALAARLELV
jgi:hypothetical protein